MYELPFKPQNKVIQRCQISHGEQFILLENAPSTLKQMLEEIDCDDFPDLPPDFVIAVIEKKEISSFLTTEDQFQIMLDSFKYVQANRTPVLYFEIMATNKIPFTNQFQQYKIFKRKVLL